MDTIDINKMNKFTLLQYMIDNNITLQSVDASKLPLQKPLNPNQIYNITNEAALSMGLNLENEPFYYIFNDKRALFVRATAGAGKTTITLFKIVKDIALRGLNPRGSCILSFSKSSVRDVEEKIKTMIFKFNIVTQRYGIHIGTDSIPNIRSLNSLTFNIVNQFKTDFGLEKFTIISDELAMSTMKRILLNNLANTEYTATDNMAKALIRLHDYSNEVLANVEDMANDSVVTDVNLPLELIEHLLGIYRTTIKIQGTLHQSDTCRLIVERCQTDNKFKDFIGNLYNTIVIDEAQDVSKCVYMLLLYMINDKNNCRIIGDDDQRIYGFKGALQEGCQKFREDISDIEVCKMSVNRRCSKNVLEYAKVILNNIQGRIPMEVNALRENESKPIIKYYNDKFTVIDEIASTLNIDNSKLNDICIGYRKNITCFYIVNKFLELGIPFRIKDDFKPGSDLLSRSLKDIFELLQNPSSTKKAVGTLFKICGIKKLPPLEIIDEVLDKKGKLTQKDLSNPEIIKDYYDEIFDIEDLEYFYEIPIKYLGIKNNGSTPEDDMLKIKELSQRLKKRENICNILMDIMALFNKNYWCYTKMLTDFPQDLEDLIMRDFSREMSWIEYKFMKIDQEEAIRKYTAKGIGVQLSTMHALKGLEFQTVHLIELEDGSFPLINDIDGYSDEEVTQLVNDELRLFYVACTRAKDNLYLYWSNKNPSAFKFLNDEYLKKFSDDSTNDSLEASVFSDLKDFSDTSVPTLDNLSDLANVTLDTDLNLDLNLDNVNSNDLDLKLELNLDKNQNEENVTVTNVSSLVNELEFKENIEEDSSYVEKIDDLNLFNESSINDSKYDQESEKINKALDEVKNTKSLKEVEFNDLSQLKTVIDTSIPEYIGDMTEDEIREMFHPEEDFKDVKNGEELSAFLSLVAQRILV